MTTDSTLVTVHRLVWMALFAACIAVGGYISFPLGGVPFTLQTMFVLLAGLVLGPAAGAGAAALYLLAGVIGLPVFAGGTAGLARVLGPTGGYLAGFVAGAALAGLAIVRKREKLSWTRGLVFSLLGMTAIFILGLIRLKLVLDLTWTRTLVAGLWPFLPTTLLQVVGAVALGRYLHARDLVPG